jgi:hypothetical protein
VARGVVRPGAWPMEQAVPASTFMTAVRERGFYVTERWE